MPGESRHDPALESLAQARRVNLACERFELAWRAGEVARIEDVLSGAEPGDRQVLLRELLALEIELRRDRGEAACRFGIHGAVSRPGRRRRINLPRPGTWRRAGQRDAWLDSQHTGRDRLRRDL